MGRLFFILFFGLFVSRLHAQLPDSSVNARVNVILIISDGHGVSDLGCYGSTVIKTPNLDRLASVSIRMDQAYSSSASACANLSVILTGIMNHASGQYGESNGFSHFSVFPEIKSLPWYLDKAGYRTARIGRFPFSTDTNFRFTSVLGYGINQRNCIEMADCCASFITEGNADPFFLLFCLADPGRSNEPMDEAKFGADRFGNKEEGYDGIIPKFYNPGKMDLPQYLPNTPQAREEYAQYAQALSRMDLGIGRLLYHLQKSGKWDNTLIIYLSSCGPDFPGVTNNLCDANIHLPLIVKPPCFRAKDETCDAMVSWADILPTILVAAKALPAENRFQGRSFYRAMFGENPGGWDEIYTSHTFGEITAYYPMRAIRTRKYKLIRNIAWQLPFPLSNRMKSSASWQGMVKSENPVISGKSFDVFFHRPEFEFYDLTADPYEQNNESTNPKYQEIIETLKTKLTNFLIETNDPWVINENHP